METQHKHVPLTYLSGNYPTVFKQNPTINTEIQLYIAMFVRVLLVGISELHIIKSSCVQAPASFFIGTNVYPL
jgi:hypothetical protein